MPLLVGFSLLTLRSHVIHCRQVRGKRKGSFRIVIVYGLRLSVIDLNVDVSLFF